VYLYGVLFKIETKREDIELVDMRDMIMIRNRVLFYVSIVSEY